MRPVKSAERRSSVFPVIVPGLAVNEVELDRSGFNDHTKIAGRASDVFPVARPLIVAVVADRVEGARMKTSGPSVSVIIRVVV